MSHIRRFFHHNFQWKLLALVSAFLIWLIVVNTSNPQVNDSLTIPFDVLNEKALVTSSQIYTLSTDKVTVTYTVRQKFKSNVTEDSFSAYINLEDYSVAGTVPVYIEVDSAVSELISDMKVTPNQIHVYTESIQQKKFAVKPYLQGEVADGYVTGEPSVNPEYIYVKGPVSVMGQISSVGIYIDVDGQSEDLEGTTGVVFLDANGNEISGIEETLSFAGDISFTLPIYRIKPLSVNAFTGGTPETGYTVDSVETSPTFISVYGPEEILAQYSYILIPGNAINVNGIRENKTYIIDCTPYIPDGLKLAGQTPEITVYVKVRNIFENAPQSSVQVEETGSTETASQALEEHSPEQNNETIEEAVTEETENTEPENAASSETDVTSSESETEPSESVEETESTEETLPAAES